MARFGHRRQTHLHSNLHILCNILDGRKRISSVSQWYIHILIFSTCHDSSRFQGCHCRSIHFPILLKKVLHWLYRVGWTHGRSRYTIRPFPLLLFWTSCGHLNSLQSFTGQWVTPLSESKRGSELNSCANLSKISDHVCTYYTYTCCKYLSMSVARSL